MSLFKNFHVSFFVFSVILSGIILSLEHFIPSILADSIWSVYLFTMILSYLVGTFSIWLYKKSSENLLQIKLLGMVLRIIASLGFITWGVIAGEKNILLFISNFFILFLFYLIFDIYTFISNLRPISK